MSGSLRRFFRNPRAQGGSKTAKNSQKWPKMAKNDSIRLPHGKTPQILVFQTKWTVIESNYGPSFIYAHIVKCIGLKGLKMPPPLKSPNLTLWTKMTIK